MSVQFGRWNFEGEQPAPDYIEKVNASLAPYGPDSNESFSKNGVTILYRSFCTTKESHRETQPCVSPSGAVITWDGRLDNRADLICRLSDSLTVNSTDVGIVAAAYEQWGANCLGKLIGDWALSIWNPRERSVLLAKDSIGTKHLYYSFDDKQLTWSTIVDPLVLFAGKTFEICEEYIAGWFSYFPAPHLSPYVGIHSVPPSSSVLVRSRQCTASKYWNFDPAKKIRYRTDPEYEEHFRSVFATAVRRTLRSDRPILAELSGGMDSSSIVCMADKIIGCGEAACPRLDTVSWYDDTRSEGNERPYFTKVEEKRGRTGCHIDLASLRAGNPQKPFDFEFANSRFAATPIPSNFREAFYKQHAAYMLSHGHRVTLCGIGGDDVTGGGVPTPRPELQDLIARARFLALARQLNVWAAKMRKSRLPLLLEAARGFFLPTSIGIPNLLTVPWFAPGFVRRNRSALSGYQHRLKLFGPLPSFQDNLAMLNTWREIIAYFPVHPKLLRELRYPYLDRDFLEFMYAIPREQIVGVGRRRHLMRRALVGIVPDELLNRRQNAPVQPDLPKHSSTGRLRFPDIGRQPISSSIGIIDADRLNEMLQKSDPNQEVPSKSLMRTLSLEAWLYHLRIYGVLIGSISHNTQDNSSSVKAKDIRARGPVRSSAS